MPIDQWLDLGYENHNSLLNLGSLAIFFYLYLLRIVFYYFMYPIVRITKRFSEWHQKLGEQLFFGEGLSILIEAYFEFLISGYL